MYSFQLNKQTYQIPETAHEITLGTFINLRKLKENDHMGMLTELLGAEPDLTGNIADIERQLKNIFVLISKLVEDVQLRVSAGELLKPIKTIEVMGLELETANFVNKAPYWAYVQTRQIIAEEAQKGKDNQFDGTDRIPEILAHNLYKAVTRKTYNEELAEEFTKDIIHNIGFIPAMQLGNFFFLKHKDLWVSRKRRWRIHMNRMKLTLVSMFSRNIVSTTYSKLLAAEMSSIGKK